MYEYLFALFNGTFSTAQVIWHRMAGCLYMVNWEWCRGKHYPNIWLDDL